MCLEKHSMDTIMFNYWHFYLWWTLRSCLSILVCVMVLRILQQIIKHTPHTPNNSQSSNRQKNANTRLSFFFSISFLEYLKSFWIQKKNRTVIFFRWRTTIYCAVTLVYHIDSVQTVVQFLYKTTMGEYILYKHYLRWFNGDKLTLIQFIL